MSKNTTKSILAAFALTFFSSLAVIGGGVLLASVFISNSFIQQYDIDDMDYSEKELLEIQTKDKIFEKNEVEVEVKEIISVITTTPVLTLIPKTIERDKYDKLFKKLTKRATLLQAKNDKLEISLPIENVTYCLKDMSFKQFKNFSSDPKEAFNNALGYCSFYDFSLQIQDRIDTIMKRKKKEETEKKVHSFSGVVVPQYVIDEVLNSENWNKTTRTLLGNQHNIDHDITYLNNVDLSNLGITELIGVGLSKYPHSSRSRKTNLRNAASKLDGKIIHPEGTLSLVNTLAPFNYNNGYVNGIIIKDGKDVTAMGGGVCQSVTTMFRAWQNSGLEVTKFQPHSKSISYYGGIGFDATMYKSAWRGGDVDLLLKNNSENSILIKVVDSDPYQIIFLYGTKDRKVSLNRYHFSKYKGNQVAKWKRSIEYKNSGEWVDNFFQEWQKLY